MGGGQTLVLTGLLGTFGGHKPFSKLLGWDGGAGGEGGARVAAPAAPTPMLRKSVFYICENYSERSICCICDSVRISGIYFHF